MAEYSERCVHGSYESQQAGYLDGNMQRMQTLNSKDESLVLFHPEVSVPIAGRAEGGE